MNIEYIIQGLILNNLLSVNSTTLSIVLASVCILLFQHGEIIYKWMILYICKRYNEIHFQYEEKSIASKRFKAIMFSMMSFNNPSIRVLAEHVVTNYSENGGTLQDQHDFYRINQRDVFTIDKHVYGRIKIFKKHIQKYGNTIPITVYKLIVFSDTLSVVQLKEWVEERLTVYERHLTDKIYSEQYVFSVKYSNDGFVVGSKKWTSNSGFDNKFFKDKDTILSKINFFIHNRDWYKKKGIPYTLGILLHGVPGCGKTSFIKALLNHTRRHAVSIQLSEKMDMKELTDIINRDKVDGIYTIPVDKKIIILEDIDCMEKILHQRSDSTYPLPEEDTSLETKLKYLVSPPTQTSPTNSLSDILNMLDGIEESDGRILIMTSNRPEVLDPALIRPGRVDIQIHFEKASLSVCKQILEHYYDTQCTISDTHGYIDGRYTHAEIVNVCRSYTNIEDCVRVLGNTVPL